MKNSFWLVVPDSKKRLCCQGCSELLYKISPLQIFCGNCGGFLDWDNSLIDEYKDQFGDLEKLAIV